MSVIKQLTLQTGPGPEFTQLMLIHRKVLKLLQSSLGLILIGFYPTLLSCVEMFSCR